jgi:malate dehydrogenase (oxaloacetate-decarboxylating)(NADP+)
MNTNTTGAFRTETDSLGAKLVFDSGLARVDPPNDMVAFIRAHVYKPEYSAEAMPPSKAA